MESHIPESDRTLIISEKTYLVLEDIAASERKKIKNPLLKQLRTPKSVAQKILAEAVSGKGRRE